MTAPRWWLAGVAALVAALIVGVSIWMTTKRSDSDCTTVHELIEFNHAHNQALTAQSDPNSRTETSISDYQAWAARLNGYADEIEDPDLKPHARQVADLASRTVTIVQQARDDAAQSPGPGPPPWVQEYARANDQFRDEIAALQKACPG